MTESQKFNTLEVFGLDAIISDEDDAQLWEAVLKKYWPNVMTAEFNQYTLYFDVADYDLEAKNALRSIEAWELDRVGKVGFYCVSVAQQIVPR